MSTVRCAIYTRKSTEEGLDMQFNSLDAQREACEAYITSQKHEGWKVLPEHYDDGGFSGGNTQRPALAALLTDIALGKVDLVVVYKIDRLTRSLTDFSKMVEVFDQHQTSFVSVTQHFNTTTSMGRLTLNVLLSFAQFEREVTGERIRDKIAATKKKGMWAGGNAPLGYDVKDKALVVNAKEAEQVRQIYRRYLELGSALRLKADLDQRKIRSKARIDKNGRQWGGARFSRGALYCVLQNRTYLGQITHDGTAYPGLHEPIVPPDLWDKVQVLIQANKHSAKHRTRADSPSLLAGRVFLDDGTRLTPVHTNKRGKRYRYYSVIYPRTGDEGKPRLKVSLPAHDLETLIEREWKAMLTSQALKDRLARNEEHGLESTRQLRLLASTWDGLPLADKLQRLEEADAEITVSLDKIVLSANPEGIIERRIHTLTRPTQQKKPNPITRTIQASLHILQGEKKIVGPDNQAQTKELEHQREQLLRRIAQGRAWANELIEGKVESPSILAQREKKSESYIYDVLRAGCLSPGIVAQVIEGEGPVIGLDSLMAPIAIAWAAHSRLIPSVNR